MLTYIPKPNIIIRVEHIIIRVEHIIIWYSIELKTYEIKLGEKNKRMKCLGIYHLCISYIPPCFPFKASDLKDGTQFLNTVLKKLTLLDPEKNARTM